jgi:uncharacterized membrane protein YhhN
MLLPLLSLAILASAFVAIVADYRGPRFAVYLCKPLAALLILLAALVERTPADRHYRLSIAVGLLCSLAGDIFLMPPRDRFVAGLVSFLLAHGCYIVAFTTGGFHWILWPLAPFLVVGAVVLGALWPLLGDRRLPVLVYMLAIVTMAWQAARWSGLHTAAAGLAAAGSALFVLSDSVLAWNRFARPFRAAQAVVLSTYFAAQWLIALSTRQ